MYNSMIIIKIIAMIMIRPTIIMLIIYLTHLGEHGLLDQLEDAIPI